MMEQTTVLIPAWNEFEALKSCVQYVREYNPKVQLIVVNNGSVDGTQEWLEQQDLDAIYFDEGIQPLGKVFNVVLDNFSIGEHLILIWPNVKIGKNTLQEIVHTLQAKEDVGIVGCCSNENPYEQDIVISNHVELLAIEETRKEMEDCEVVGNIGFCYGMNREMLMEVGSFDENLAYMDVMLDYQLRAIQKGYKNRVASKSCVFEEKVPIFHEQWLGQLWNADRQYLRKKWNTNYFNLCANYKFHPFIHRERTEKFSVLEVGCDMGANLLGIKNQFPNCDIYGLELSKSSAEIGSHLAKICYGNIEEEKEVFGVKFDYIIFGDVLEHLHHPQGTVEYCKKLLNENGCIIASIPNLMHITVMEQLLKGEFRYTDIGLLDKTHIHLFTQKEIVKMFWNANYEIEEMQGISYQLEDNEEELLEKLMQISDSSVTREMYTTYQYTVLARKIK